MSVVKFLEKCPDVCCSCYCWLMALFNLFRLSPPHNKTPPYILQVCSGSVSLAAQSPYGPPAAA